MSAEQDAANNGKKTFSIIMLGLLIALAGGYWLISWWHHDDGADSAVNLNGTATSAGSQTTETPRYRELLKASNDRGAAEAARNNTTFIASLPVGLDSREPPQTRPPEPDRPPPVQREPPPAPRSQASAAAEQQANEKRQERLQKLLTRISLAQGKGTRPERARLLHEGDTVTSPNVSVTTASLSTAVRQTPTPQTLIPALTRVGASMETAVDSDNPNSQVVAEIPAGFLAGARLHSASVKLAGNGVEIHFSRMSWQGKTFNVNAYAQSERNLMSSVASDVSHRWGTHIVLPAILGGMGNVGSLYKESNTQILQTNMSTVTGRAGKPDAGTVAGVIAGGTAQKGAEVISQEMAREPFRQVTVNQDEVISILFVDAVTPDDVVGQKNSASPATSTSAPSGMAAAEQLSETRLQEAIARRQAEIRRQYGGTEPSKEYE